jgi:hypothetical protein
MRCKLQELQFVTQRTLPVMHDFTIVAENCVPPPYNMSYEPFLLCLGVGVRTAIEANNFPA